MLYLKKLLSLLAMLSLFASCGDLFMTKEDSDDDYNQFATCKFDTEAISKIMTKKIKGELLCLESNLYLFIKLVKSPKPGSLPRAALKTYIKENIKDFDIQAFDILDGIFDLNALLFGDDVNYMSKKNVEKLTDLLIEFNTIVVDGKIFKYFSTEERVSFYEHNKRKSEIYSSFVRISNLFKNEIVENDQEILISEFLSKFKNLENKDILRYSNALLFLKKAFLGGEAGSLSAKDLQRLVLILGDVGKVIYDFVNLPDTNTSFYEEEEIAKILKEDIQTVYNNFYYKNDSNEKIVSYDEILNVTKIFFPDLVKYVSYKGAILKAKEILLGSDSENFTAEEITFLLVDFLYKNAAKGVFVYRSYMRNEGFLTMAKRVWNDFLDLITFSAEEEEFIGDFNRVVKQYRFYQGSEFSPLFGEKFKRNPRGLFDILLYEDIVKRVFAYYGTLDPKAEGDYVLSQKQLGNFLLDFKDLFEGEGFILPGRAENTAETISLMTSLFHIQSDGDAIIEIPEFVEFIITMTSSLNFANDMHSFMLKKCEKDNQDRVHPTCFRENFIDFLESENEQGVKIANYVPQLKVYLESFNTQLQIDDYLISTSRFSRTCSLFPNGEEVPMKWGDFIVSWAGLLAIEQSMIKFDKNGTGVLEPREVDQAFRIYKAAVEAMIPYDFLKRYAKTFFRYLVKYKKVPEIPEVKGFRSLWKALREGYHFVKFVFSSKKNQEADADRMTFASVLKIIAENSPTNIENPYPCENLR